jgi:hypothetical protein
MHILEKLRIKKKVNYINVTCNSLVADLQLQVRHISIVSYFPLHVLKITKFKQW